MSSIFNFFNIFSQTPSLRINGQKRPASIFGSIVGFCSITILIGAMIYILFNYFSRLDYTINSYTDNLAKPNIDLKDFKLRFVITDTYGNEFPDYEKLFKISAKFWDIYLPVLGENKTQKIEISEIPVVLCKNLNLTNIDSDAISLVEYSKMYNILCLDFSVLNKNLTGVYGNLGRYINYKIIKLINLNFSNNFLRYSTINVYFQKCTNSSNNNTTNCYPDDFIEETLKTIYVSTTVSDNDVKLDDVNDPFKGFYNNYITQLTTSVFKNHIREMSEVRIFSDKNLIFGSYEEKKSFKITRQREEVDLRSDHQIFPGTFNQMTFITSGNTLIYYRDYRKLFDIIVRIGGFFNGIIYIAYIILYLYSKNLILWHCISSTISTNELEERLTKPIKINNSNNNSNNNFNYNDNNNKNNFDLNDNNLNNNNNKNNIKHNIFRRKSKEEDELNNKANINNQINDISNEQLRINQNYLRK